MGAVNEMTTQAGGRKPIPRLWRALAVAVVLGVLLLFVLVFTGLNPVHFSGQIRTPVGLPGASAGPPDYGPFIQSLPRGPTITVHWAVAGATEVVFEVIPPGLGSTFPCYQRGSSDSCSFVSVGGSYTFQAFGVANPPVSEIVNVTGVYLVPFL